MTLYKAISGGAIITDTDFQKNVSLHNGKGGDFNSGWYAINSNPQCPTHTFLNGVLMTFDESYTIGERELFKSHPELNP